MSVPTDGNITLTGTSVVDVLLGDATFITVENITNKTLSWRVKGGTGRGVLFPNDEITKPFDLEVWFQSAKEGGNNQIHVTYEGLNTSRVEMDYGDAIARGLIPGARVGQGVGNTEGITALSTGYDISEIGSALIPSPDIENGETMAFVSNSLDDNPTGIGAREVTIKYIHPVTKTLETLILPTSGTTETVIPQDMAFSNDFYVSKNGIIDGEHSAAQGDITLYRQGTPLRIYSVIKANGNKSFTMSRLIPDNKDLFISGYTLSGNTKGVSVRLRATIGDDGTLTDGWLFKLPLTIGDTAIPIQLNPPIKISAGARLKVSVFGANVPGVDVSVFINGTLEPKR